MALMGRLQKKSFVADQSLLSAMRQSRQVRDRIATAEYDVIIGLAASPAFSFLKTKVPTIQVTDATIEAMRGFYPMFSNLDPLFELQMRQVGKLSHENTDAFCVASNWAKNSLINHYSIDDSRVVVAPFGPSIEAEQSSLNRTPSESLRALLVASDWERKGGDLVVRAIRIAQAAGVQVELTVVGQTSQEASGILSLGRVSAKEMSELYASSDLVVELSRASAGGVVLTDAMHHGIPAIAFDTGGVSDIITDGENGRLIDESLSDTQAIDEAAKLIISLAEDPLELERLSTAAKSKASSNNSWKSWTEAMTALVQRVT
ncbi:glycosyltransferase family 4 protein [Neomicrococcus lactis]|uniref:glycosyltransferase family 4 protein n=1 Tax=Neomicrococcus lactis TaxID=732241 RepID=UPI0022FFFA67|nr:glycosyltransferase family 4 protein [Neomicrococcus lactis]